MSDQTTPNPATPSAASGDGLDLRDQLDLLVSRIVDGEASEADWTTFAALAERHPLAWKVLAQSQRDNAALSLTVNVALHAADRVDLPSPDAAQLWTARRAAPARIRTWSRLGAVSGWAAAAVIAFAAYTGAISPRPSAGNPDAFTQRPLASSAPIPTPAGGAVQTAGWMPEDFVRGYMETGARTGQVIGELPSQPVVEQPVVLESGQRAVKVVFIRKFVEQAVITDLARPVLDESGRIIAVPVAPAVPLAGPQ